MKVKISLLFFIFIIILGSCMQHTDKQYISEIKSWQDTMNLEFADREESPLDSLDFLKFKGLEFFAIDKKYRVEADFIRTPNEQPFGMKTTTDRLPVYVKYGEVFFKIDNKECKINIYQNQDLIKKPEYADYLFIPFMDKTSGNESYRGGRYIDLKIPSGDKIMIDFNKAYNPYCAYNHKYSCPIPPYDNKLDVEIRAGVKAFRGDD